MMDHYRYVSSILLRDIFKLEGDHLRFVTRSYMMQCVRVVEECLKKHGGLQTLRVRLNSEKHCIDFIGENVNR